MWVWRSRDCFKYEAWHSHTSAFTALHMVVWSVIVSCDREDVGDNDDGDVREWFSGADAR